MQNEILVGDALDVLSTLPDNTFQCCVTSPPYYGLRDYGVDGQLGNESTPQEYIEKLVRVFAEVRRTLRHDGVLWLNLGDSYANDSKWGGHTSGKHASGIHNTAVGRRKRSTGLKSKDLIGIPWEVAFALREDGWYLRSDVIWAKGNCMPESVKDRPTKSHEYVFLLSKSPEYYYDSEAVREPASPNKPWAASSNGGAKNAIARGDGGNLTSLGKPADELRNRRSVWTINTRPYKGAHFAVMPAELAKICILAGSSEKGACAQCGAPYRRAYVKGERDSREGISNGIAPENNAAGTRTRDPTKGGGNWLASVPKTFEGWEATCRCDTTEIVPCLILDPFSGSGTTAAEAARAGRDFVGVELNPDYVQLSTERLAPVLEARAQGDLFSMLQDLEEEA